MAHAPYLQWHMRRSLAPMLFDETDPAAREAPRTSPVVKAELSPATPCSAISLRSPAMSSAWGAIASPPSCHLHPTQRRALDLPGLTPTP
jgi:hypothetical protein